MAADVRAGSSRAKVACLRGLTAPLAVARIQCRLPPPALPATIRAYWTSGSPIASTAGRIPVFRARSGGLGAQLIRNSEPGTHQQTRLSRQRIDQSRLVTARLVLPSRSDRDGLS